MLPKLAYVTHYYPFRGGYGNIVADQLRFLSRHFDIHLFYFFKKEDDSENIDISRFIVKEHALETGFKQIVPSSELGKARLGLLRDWNLLYRMVKNHILHGVQLYFAPYYSENAVKKIACTIKTENIRYLWAYSAFGGAICKEMAFDRKFLYLCDSFGYLYHNLSKIEKNPFMKLFLIWNSRASAAFELSIRKHYDRIAFINADDAKWLGLKPHEYAILRHMRGKTIFRQTKKGYDLVLAGYWGYLPNADSLEYALERIFPKLKRKCTVLVVGMNLGKKLQARLMQAKNVHAVYRGNVDDYFGAISSARLFLLPIRAGAGTCNKLLDGLEAGLPVLTTPFLKGGHDKGSKCRAIISCNNEDEFANRIEQLLGDGSMRSKLGMEGRKFYLEEFSNAEKEYEKAVKLMLGKAKKARGSA
ncbi:MAG: glycosyltransferase, partial [Candidatus Micrarchaeia archaeon]